MPTISIITSTLNSLQKLRETAESIFFQTHGINQWIIVDGLSNDGTRTWLSEICKAHPEIIYISEPDGGVYDAWNKALPLCQSDWVIFLGAGDTLLDNNTIEKCITFLEQLENKTTLAYGSVIYRYPLSEKADTLSNHIWQGLKGPWETVRPVLPCHQGIFHRTTLFSEGFYFDESCRICSDSELVLRELLRGKGRPLEITISVMPQDGMSSNKINRLMMIREQLYINRKVGIFWSRPIYQIAVLLSNSIKHLFRVIEHRKHR